MDNIYPWRKFTNIERIRMVASQGAGVCSFFEIGTNWNINRLFGNDVLNYPAAGTLNIRDGIQIKSMYLNVNLKNNSNVDYLLHIYELEPRWDTSTTPTTIINSAFTNLGINNNSILATVNNMPTDITLFDLPECTAHFKMKLKKTKLRAGKQLFFQLHPNALEDRVHNSAILTAGGLAYRAKYTKIMILVAYGAIAHEFNDETILVRTEIKGIDIERSDNYYARVVKEPIQTGNLTKYYNPTVVNNADTIIAVPNGAYLTKVNALP